MICEIVGAREVTAKECSHGRTSGIAEHRGEFHRFRSEITELRGAISDGERDFHALLLSRRYPFFLG